ncbi:MAG: hypothetical protein HDQ87_09100 [Clostridia bacterium]|nr:hypothetical protein [Clostridia bacterium]
MLRPDGISKNRILRIQSPVRPGGQYPNYHVDYQPGAQQAPSDEINRELELRRFRDQVYRRLDSMPSHYTVESFAVDISEDGFAAMFDDSQYYSQILGQIRREFSTSYAPRRVRVHIQVGHTFDEYQVHSWASAYAGDFEIYAKHSFYRRAPGAAPASAASDSSLGPSAYDIYRDHLQMQFEKFDRHPPQNAPQPQEKTHSVYEEMGYEDAEPENHNFEG